MKSALVERINRIATSHRGLGEQFPGRSCGTAQWCFQPYIPLVGVCAVLFTLLEAATSSQSKPLSATDLSKSEIEAVLKSPEGGGDRQIKVADMGKYNVGVGVLHRGVVKNDGAPVRGLSHTQVTEVYYILSGAGTLVTGGTMVDPTPMASDAEVVRVAVGPSISGTTRGGHTRQVAAGDVVIIPQGVFHGWREVPDHVTYLSVRPDPDRVLPAGYVSPALKK